MTYTIKQVSEMMSLPVSTIRYYDKMGLIPFLEKNESGYRHFRLPGVEFSDSRFCVLPFDQVVQFSERLVKSAFLRHCFRLLQVKMQTKNGKARICKKSAFPVFRMHERLMYRRSVIPFHFSNNSGLFYPMREELFTAYRCRTAKHSRNHSETQACVYNTGIETTQLRRALRLQGAARYLYIVRSCTT